MSRPDERARDAPFESDPRQLFACRECGGDTLLDQCEIGVARISSNRTPFGFAVAKEYQLARHPCTHLSTIQEAYHQGAAFGWRVEIGRSAVRQWSAH